MKKSTAIIQAVVIGGFIALSGTLFNLLAIPLFGELPLINLLSIFVCVLIGIIGGVSIYVSNKQFIKE